MLFPTITFAAFFMIVWPASWLVARWPLARQVVLLVASWVFYAYWDARFVALLAGTVVLVQLGARAVAASARRPRLQTGILGTAIALHLAVLGAFKYYGFFATSLTTALADLGIAIDPPLIEVAAAVGLSFFTFEAISYLVEVRREVVAPGTLLEVATWLSFFPTLASGPITRASELFPQLRRRPERAIEANRAFWLILRGLFKKVVLASFLASAIVDDVFATPDRYAAPVVLVAIYAYAAQLYLDFSGYTDMAIGIALLLGFTLPANFDAPYSAHTVTEFWTRWHMTLSRWLRDFVFTPLARHSAPTTAATCRNLIVVMLLAGLWHGAAWTFVAFGAVHGVAMALERVARQRRRQLGRVLLPTPLRRAGRQVRTFHVVCLGWVFFRADSLSAAADVLGRLVTGWGPVTDVTWILLLVVAGVLATQVVPRRVADQGATLLARVPAGAAAVLIALGLLVTDVLGPEGVPPFIYFGF